MFKKILIPLDGSKLAEKAIEQARKLATQFEAELHVLRVYGLEQVLADPHSAFDTYHLVVTADEAEKRAVNYLGTIEAALSDLGESIKINVVESNEKIGKSIADYAIKNDIELIVMTSHGYTGFRHLVMGSVTTETLHHTHCPVLVVPAIGED